MAEAEQNDKNAPTPHRRPYHPHQNRSGSSYRGRGRANASVSKALYLFGVRDLREILDRKHQDEEQTENGPPPDPSYNYLKDPSRESANEHQTHNYHKEQHSERISGDTHPRGHNFRGYRGRGRGGGITRENRHYESEKEGRGGGIPRENRHYESEKEGRGGGIPRENRHYESEKEGRGGGIPREIRHYESEKEDRGGGIPRENRHYKSEKENRGGVIPREHRHYESEKLSFLQNPINIKVEVLASTGERNCKLDQETKIAEIKHIPNYKLKDLRPRNEGAAGKTFSDSYRNERGRGRWQRGRRGRGSAERGRGRGRGRYSNRNNENDENNQSQRHTTIEEASKENSDQNIPIKNEEGNENEENNEEEYTEDQENEDEGQEQYYEGEEESSEVHEQNESLVEEAAGGDEMKLEDNLVITSLENDETRKRTVKFKLDDAQSEQGAKGDEKESSQKKADEKLDATNSGE